MGALDMGIPEEELQSIVSRWRDANPAIVALWWDVDRAVKEAIKGHTMAETHGIYFQYQRAVCSSSRCRLAEGFPT